MTIYLKCGRTIEDVSEDTANQIIEVLNLKKARWIIVKDGDGSLTIQKKQIAYIR